MITMIHLDERSKNLIANYTDKVLEHVDQALMAILHAGFGDNLVVESPQDIRVYQEKASPRLHLELARINREWLIIDCRQGLGLKVVDALRASFECSNDTVLIGILMVSLGWAFVDPSGRIVGRSTALSTPKARHPPPGAGPTPHYVVGKLVAFRPVSLPLLRLRPKNERRETAIPHLEIAWRTVRKPGRNRSGARPKKICILPVCPSRLCGIVVTNLLTQEVKS